MRCGIRRRISAPPALSAFAICDGSALWTKALGLQLDLTARNMGIRSNRYSMLVENGIVKQLNVEGPGKFEVSDAETMLKQM